MYRKTATLCLVTGALLSGAQGSLQSALAADQDQSPPVEIYTGTGDKAADLLPVVDQFRQDIDGTTGEPTDPNGLSSGVRREVNWDDINDTFSAQNNLGNFPLDYFQTVSPRGILLTDNQYSYQYGYQVSMDDNSDNDADPDNVAFSNINPGYADDLSERFSGQRIFAPLFRNKTSMRITVPGTNTPSYTKMFGVVFTDVEKPGSSVTYYDQYNQRIAKINAPTAGNQNLSFVGVKSLSQEIHYVEIQNGTTGLWQSNNDLSDGGKEDIVALDNLIYQEPQKTSTVSFQTDTGQDISEGKSLQVTITRAGALPEGSIQLATSDSTAQAPGDYKPINERVHFQKGQTVAHIYVEANQDTTSESQESFQLQMSSAENMQILDDGKNATKSTISFKILDAGNDYEKPIVTVKKLQSGALSYRRLRKEGVKFVLGSNEYVSYTSTLQRGKRTLDARYGNIANGAKILQIRLGAKQIKQLRKKHIRRLSLHTTFEDRTGNKTEVQRVIPLKN